MLIILSERIAVRSNYCRLMQSCGFENFTTHYSLKAEKSLHLCRAENLKLFKLNHSKEYECLISCDRDELMNWPPINPPTKTNNFAEWVLDYHSHLQSDIAWGTFNSLRSSCILSEPQLRMFAIVTVWGHVIDLPSSAGFCRFIIKLL